MQLRQYFGLIRKYVPILIILTALAAGAAYFYSQSIRPTYRSQVILLVTQQTNTAAGYYDPAYGYTNLAQAYTLLVTQRNVLEKAAQDLNWSAGWQNLYFHVSATATGQQLINVYATDRDPSRAKDIADAVALEVVQQSPASQQRIKVESDRAKIQSQLDDLEQQLEKGREKRDALQKLRDLENDPAKGKDLDAQLTLLQDRIDEWQKMYVSLLPQLPAVPANDLTILASARVPEAPYIPNTTQNVLVAGAGGLLLALALAFLLEYLDDTIKTGEDARRVLGLPALSTIARIGGRSLEDRLITWKQPRSPVSEAYRLLRTNLRYAGIENPSGVLLVTSPLPKEGKTTTACNLAITMAQAGKRVVLLDADLRRPCVDKLFGIPNDAGLSDLFLAESLSLEKVMQPSAVEGLRIIPSGPIPPNPAELLDSSRMTEILNDLRLRADIVILDCPPILPVADATILGPRCSGALIVVDPRISRNETCRRAVEAFKQAKVRTVGVVLNRLGARSGGYYYQNNYYSSPQAGPGESGTESKPKNHKLRLKPERDSRG